MTAIHTSPGERPGANEENPMPHPRSSNALIAALTSQRDEADR